SQQENRGDRDEDVLRIADRQKIDGAAADDRHRDDKETDHQAQKHPCPYAAEHEHELLQRRRGDRRSDSHFHRDVGFAIGHSLSSSSAGRMAARLWRGEGSAANGTPRPLYAVRHVYWPGTW